MERNVVRRYEDEESQCLLRFELQLLEAKLLVSNRLCCCSGSLLCQENGLRPMIGHII